MFANADRTFANADRTFANSAFTDRTFANAAFADRINVRERKLTFANGSLRLRTQRSQTFGLRTQRSQNVRVRRAFAFAERSRTQTERCVYRSRTLHSQTELTFANANCRSRTAVYVCEHSVRERLVCVRGL